MTIASAWCLLKLLIGLWAMCLLISGLRETINKDKM
jgi:hypothetical protein